MSAATAKLSFVTYPVYSAPKLYFVWITLVVAGLEDGTSPHYPKALRLKHTFPVLFRSSPCRSTAALFFHWFQSWL